MQTPDNNAAGLTAVTPDALRYDGHSENPCEVAGMFRSMMPVNVRVLDVGCGTGAVTLIANRGKGNEVLAVEPDPARAAVAKSRSLNVHCGVLDETFTQVHGKFDVVMSSDVLEHMAAPAEALKLFAMALKPEGLVLISVPNVAHWSVRANLLIGRFEYEDVGIMDATHLRWFTSASISRLLNDCGFQILKTGQTAGVDLPVYTRSIISRCPRRLRSPAIRLLVRLFPRLFGAQHVLAARKRN